MPATASVRQTGECLAEHRYGLQRAKMAVPAEAFLAHPRSFVPPIRLHCVVFVFAFAPLLKVIGVPMGGAAEECRAAVQK